MNKIKNIAIIFGKKEPTNFNRYTFPILNRPVVMYSILATKFSSSIDKTYLSTDSSSLISLGKEVEGVKLLQRKVSKPTLTQEIQNSLKKVKKDLGYYPHKVSILFSNSPCITGNLLFNAISFLDENK